MRVEWKGGPLDGCVKDIDRPTLTYIAPDTAEPETKVLVYVLMSVKGKPHENTYDFRADLTEKANAHLAEER